MADHFPTVGVEEEYFLVDASQRTVVAAAPRILARAKPVLGDLVTGEASRYQVEGKTPPCGALGELRHELRRVRSAVVTAAAQEGLRPLASGTPLLGVRTPIPLSGDPHYLPQFEMFRSLYDTFVFCGLHVHVQVPDREHAVLVSNHLRPWLPVLVALAANSPFWEERDSGYCSWRTLGAARWPVAGPPPYFSSAAHYDALAASLQETGATRGERSLYWDVRAVRAPAHRRDQGDGRPHERRGSGGLRRPRAGAGRPRAGTGTARRPRARHGRSAAERGVLAVCPRRADRAEPRPADQPAGADHTPGPPPAGARPARAGGAR